MSIFQNTIFQKYLKTLNQETINQKWEIFKGHFHNAEIQENIRNSKEEQYQGEFLIDLFVNVLGYTKNPTPKFNLTTEYKNVKDSKKADGAIIINDKVVGIIELKGTNTTDLSKIEDQAFGYKNNQPDCKYIITSNFEKIRFYIDSAIDHLEFNLFTLSEEDFKQLYLCLSFESLNSDIPKKIKDESLSQEDIITKRLYKDYSLFKRELFQNLTELNPDINQLELFKKSQKLIDRFLFLFFGEDRFLLPPNSVRLILSDWRDLLDRDEQIPLYDRFKKYFGYLNTGFEGKRYSVFAYNGGLFKPDEILDNITIDSELLYKHTLKLSEYDFGSEVDVNILGHIFENSLNEIDEIKAQLEGQEIDKSKTKRKKDGVFYTPKYITKYIVENTVGKLCEEKKAEIGILEEEYFTDKKRQQKTKLSLLQKLDDYRNWLHQITIIDPACGSGAFLNEALNFLISEHKYIDELEAKLTGSSIAFAYHSASILENNLFGVDLNEESVEIAKLSLWLRTAEPNRKLNDLSNNIKCGNSLIDDPEIAGDKAFNWEKEFPQVFAKGGFDVVIGNPPYVNVELMPIKDKEYYRTKYSTFYKRGDLFSLFVELAISKLSKKGRISYIIPSIILNNLSYKLVRDRILDNQWLEEVCVTGGKVFQDATVDTVIITLNKQSSHSYIKLVNAIDFFNQKFDSVGLDFFKKYDNNISVGKSENNNITDKLFNENYETTENHFQVFQGVVTGNNDAFIFNNNEIPISEKIETEVLKKMCHGRDISKWYINNDERLMLYIDNSININDYPNAYNWLKRFENVLSNSKSSSEKSSEWFYLHRPRERKELDVKPKILIQNTRNESLKTRIVATIDEEGLYGTQGLNFIIPTSDYDIYSLLGLLNSKLLNFLFSTKFLNLAIKAEYLKKVQFPKDLKISKVGELSNIMSKLNIHFFEASNKFQRSLQREFSLETLSKKLQNWYELSYAEFLKELTKAKVNLSLSQKAEWEDYFLAEQQKAVSIKSQIDQTDKEIDQMVYNLYGLTEEEIEIVESN
jgi:type I restriction-modification system DNA methylase subunit